MSHRSHPELPNLYERLTRKSPSQGDVAQVLQLQEHDLSTVFETALERDPNTGFSILATLLESGDRNDRNRILTTALSVKAASVDGLNDWFNEVIRHVMEVEAVAVRRMLVSRNLEPQADEAVAFAMTQLCKQGEVEHLRSWLIRVAMREAIAIKKRESRSSAELPEGHDETVSLDEYSREQEVSAVNDACEIVTQCRKEVLDEEEDRILDFYFFQERTGNEIAELLEMPISTVYRRREIAIKKLQRCLSLKRGAQP